MFLLLRFTRIVSLVILNLFIQPMYAGDTLLLSKELTDQKEGAHYLTRDISEKAALVSGSQSWMPHLLKKRPLMCLQKPLL